MTATVAFLAFLAAPPMPQKNPAFFGVQIARGKDTDIVVQVVIPDSPAQKAGLKTGDVFVQIDDMKPADLNTTVQVIRSLQPDKTIQVIIRRDGKEKTLDVTPAAIGG